MIKFTDKAFEFNLDNIRSGKLEVFANVYPEKNSDITEIETDNIKEIGNNNVSSFLGVAQTKSFVSETDKYRLQWNLGYANRNGISAVFFRAAVTNLTDNPIYLNSIGVRSVKDSALICNGDPNDWYLGYQSTLAELNKSSYEKTVELYTVWNMPIPPKPENPELTDGRYRLHGEFVPLYSRSEDKGLFITPIGEPTAFLTTKCFVEHESPHIGEISMDIRSEMSNVLIQSGETRWGQQMAFVFGSYDEVTSSVMKSLADTHGSRVGKPPVTGWCSWYDLYSQITEDSVMSTAKAWENLKNRRPIDVIQIDDGYQIQNGAWDCNEKFPSGWEPFIETVKRAGALPGIWIAPVCVHDSTEIYKNHLDWFARNTNGDLLGPINNWGPSAYWLDVTNPEAFDFAVNTLREKYEIGFRYFKIDFNSIYVDGRTAYDSSRTSLQLYRDLYKGYREAIGEDSYLCSCSGLTRGCFGYVDSSRIGGDSPPVWEDYPDNCLSRCMEKVAETCISNGIIHSNDPDVTYLFPKHFGERPHLTPEELHSWHTTVGLLGGVQMISDAMSDEKVQQNLYMIEILTPPAPEKAHPLYPATDPKLTCLGMAVQRSFGNFSVVSVHNPEDNQVTRKVDIEKLLQIDKAYHVWSFWDKQYLGIKSSDFNIDIEAHGCKLLRFTPTVHDKNNSLLLIGSDLHISIGAAEIEYIINSENEVEISLIPYAGARDGSLYFFADKEPSSITAVGVEFVSNSWKNGILTVTLKGRSLNGSQTLKLSF